MTDIRVIYITGTGRSGSTILDLVTGSIEAYMLLKGPE
jgi:hypothetical protein